jgi:choline dehydrogenase
MDATADYVVAGAGSAGCILARRLADSGASVILLEAGGPDKTSLVRKPGMIAIFHNVPQLKKRLDWGFYTTPQEHANDRRIPQPRGRVLGGSGSVNGLLFVRGNAKNFDDWAADGCPGWAYADVLKSFKKMENWEDGATDLRGAGGPIQVTRQKDLTLASQAFIEALADTAGVKKIDDYNGESQEGAAVFQENAISGLRYSSAVGYLGNHGLPNLTVRLKTVITKVNIEGGRATGVRLANGDTVHAAKEVILTAGVFGSAQLLMLSGIGPAARLREHGIDVIADLPVGDNLHDHMFVPMTYVMKSAVNRGTAPYFFKGMLNERIRGGTWMGRTVFEAAGFVRSSLATAIPDIQIHGLPWSYPFPNQDAPVRHKVDPRSALTIMPTLIYPKSRGTLRLASADPAAAPLIDMGYLTEQDDTTVLLDGMELIREVMASKLIAGGIDLELSPGAAYPDRAALAREVPNRATSVYHAVGTCRMGSDDRAVVGPDLKVRGIDGLRVADASIMPSITGGNTNAPAMMIGEHCAAMMTGPP